MTIESNGRAAQIAGRDIINNNVINIHPAPPSSPPKPRVVIQPGPEHIAEGQRVTLQGLVDEVVRLEAVARREPKAHQSVWRALNARMKASSYHLILAADYVRAEKFLREWIGRLSSTKSAAKKDPDWRKRKYSYIFVNVKQLDKGKALDDLLNDRYGGASVKDITDEELTAVYQTVAGWKRSATARRQAKPAAVSRRV
ncbi:MAG: hypothetical protein Q7U97_14510 [Rhodocyclaceae bacterium]|nr:hypothetical protein [Rhodocyclaceae bacterium]